MSDRTSKIHVYVAGPFSKGDVLVNVREAILAGDNLRALGFVPFIPHLNALWHLVCPHEPTYWYEVDLEWLPLCKALLRLPDDSWGADREVELAIKLEIPVFYSIEELVAWFKREQEAVHA